jgi:protein-S-isoprenylcysteine O-methyltransferase Ste14
VHLQFPNLIFIGVLIAYVAIRGVFALRTRQNQEIVTRADGRDRALVIAVFVASIILPLLYIFTPWLGFADYWLPQFALLVGAIAAIIGLWLFWRSHADLGRNWSITLEMRRGHELVTHGVYRTIRHPMYAAIWLLSFAQGLLLKNWLAGWAAVAAFGLLYFVRVPREEQMMREFFGEQYHVYSQKTGRIFPGIGRAKV